MVEIEVRECEKLDDVVHRLIEEKDKGNEVYAIFEGKKLLSSSITLDSAYQEVCGCSKDDFSRMYDGACAFAGMNRILNPNVVNVVNDLRMAQLLCLTKKGKIYCPSFNERVSALCKYSINCKPDKFDKWQTEVLELFSRAIENADEIALKKLHAHEVAGEIMIAIDNERSWDEIRQIVEEQINNGCNILLLGRVMFEYSPVGKTFLDEVITDSEIYDCIASSYQSGQKS